MRARRGSLDGQAFVRFQDAKMAILRTPAARRVVEDGTDVKKAASVGGFVECSGFTASQAWSMFLDASRPT